MELLCISNALGIAGIDGSWYDLGLGGNIWLCNRNWAMGLEVHIVARTLSTGRLHCLLAATPSCSQPWWLHAFRAVRVLAACFSRSQGCGCSQHSRSGTAGCAAPPATSLLEGTHPQRRRWLEGTHPQRKRWLQATHPASSKFARSQRFRCARRVSSENGGCKRDNVGEARGCTATNIGLPLHLGPGRPRSRAD